MKNSGDTFNRIITTGNDAIKYEDTLWNDIVQPLFGKRLDVSAGKVDYDFTNIGVSFADSCTTTNDSHMIHFGYQITHEFKLDGKMHFHVHWLQAQSDNPNWWMKWRFVQNGKAVGSWTEAAMTGNAFTYTSGTIMQISTFPEIDLSTAVGGELGVSDFVDVQFTRDTTNGSGLFSGSDPVSGSVTIKGADPHLEVDRAGSRDEYIK